jgi:very-short-patch-repair endonuclease
LGVSFRRQVVLQGYIADFYASAAGLIVEVDGSWHSNRAQRDAQRERALHAAGLPRTARQRRRSVHSLPNVVSRIRTALATS